MSSFLLPFENLDDKDFEYFLKSSSCKQLFYDRLSDHGLKDFLFNVSSDPFFHVLDSRYYSVDHFNHKFPKSHNTELCIFHLNIQSLNAKHSSFCTLLALLDVNFDIIILSEIWSYNVEFYANMLEGYFLFYDLPVCSNVGGVGFFIKKSISCKPRNDLKLNTNMSDIKMENLWFELIKDKNKYIIGGIYRHPNQSVEKFSELLEYNLGVISKINIPCFIVGDINIDLLKYDCNKNVESYLDNLISHSFLPTILLPTRITSTSISLIDHIYYFPGKNNKQKFTVASGNIFSDVSDHLPNFLFLSNSTSDHCKSKTIRPLIRLFTKKNKIKFQECLSEVDWRCLLYDHNDINLCYNNFITTLLSHYNKCFPLTRISRRACRDKKWITVGLKNSSRVKNKLYEKWRKSRNKEDEEKYKAYKKVFIKVLKSAEISYYNKQFDAKINSIKRLWTNLNRVCSAKKNSAHIPVIDKLLVSGVELTDPVKIANSFNKYFCSVGPDLVKNLPKASTSYTDYLGFPLPNSIFVDSITFDEVFSLVLSLKCNKSCGHDGFGANLLKENAHLLCAPLVYIYNLSLADGVIPDSLKIAKIVPIFKKGDRNVPSNYRPISLLSVFDKLLEKIVYKRIYQFFQKYNVIYKYQFGFRKNHSTSLALLEVVDACYKNLDNNNKILGIYFDLQKAFDTCDHQILLHKLYHVGIRGVMHNWLKNYLYNRKQYTFCNGVSSDMGNITCGVPQGSVLGPLLFLVYMNDIYRAVPNNCIKLFADDTNLFIFDSSFVQLEIRANVCLEKMHAWFVANKLSLNADKTCYTLFSNKSRNKNIGNLNLFINNTKIARVVSCKYLGVNIDELLSWKIHIDYIYKKLVKFSGIFYKLRGIVPVFCLRKLYFSFVQPYILYGIEVYANVRSSALNKLHKLNNKLLRILQDKKLRTPVNHLYTAYNILPITLLHEMKILTLVHKFIHHNHLLPDIFKTYFTDNSAIHSHNTRRRIDLHFFSVSSNFGHRCSAYHCSVLWNNLPEYIKKCSSLATFSKIIKQYFMKKLL